MPELPEVETIKNGLLPHVKNKLISNTIIRQRQLRWPIPKNLNKTLKNKKITDIKRRSKYLLFYLADATSHPSSGRLHPRDDKNILAIHLGMSGNLRIVNQDTSLKKHDHVDIQLSDNKIIRYNDPRRFGAILLFDNENLDKNKYLSHLGPEPLTDSFNLESIINKAKNRKSPVKNFIMNNNIVVGVGNIYATEALFHSKINPLKPACEITQKQWRNLIVQIKKVLNKAIECGGTTLKDFTNSDGKPGYFKQELAVYGRTGKKCFKCQAVLISEKQQGRTTVYCPQCQK